MLRIAHDQRPTTASSDLKRRIFCLVRRKESRSFAALRMTTIEMSVLTKPYVANSERPTTNDCLSKLLQEPHIALKEKLNIIHAVLQNRNPLHAHAEGESRNLRRIVVDESVHIRIDHAAAQQL